MTRHLPALLVGILVVQLASAARAEEPLLLRDVLESVIQTHPKSAEAQASVDQARGRALSARGAFDPTVTGSASANPTGYYEHSFGDIGLEQRVPGTGASVKGRYRVSDGDIAPYYGERRTRSQGEVSAQLVVPLLRNFRIDSERLDLQRSDIEIRVVREAQRATQLELIRYASDAYFEWVAAGQLLEVARELAQIAELRASTIRQQAARGAIPRIQEIDADQVVLARQDSILKAKAKFYKAQQKLSLYYRSDSLQPRIVPEERVPLNMPTLPMLTAEEERDLVARAVAARPELSQIGEERKAARAELRQAKNERLPALDFQVYAARDIGVGDPSLAQTDLGVGVVLKFPIRQRKAKGKAMSIQAKLAKLEAKRRGLRDRIEADIQRASRLARVRDEQVTLAQQRWEATKRLAEAERTRFEQGASDILRINLREKAVASAASDAIDSALERNEILAELHFLVSSDLESLIAANQEE